MKKHKNIVVAQSEIRINAPIDDVWKVLAEEFAEIGKWSSGVDYSEGSGPGISGSQYSERACKISVPGFSDTKERILQYDKNHVIRYSLYSGLPGFVTNAENTWTFFDEGSITRVAGQTVAHVKGLMGCLFRSLMKQGFNRVLAEMAAEAKYYIETGQPHPRKIKAMAKYNRKKAKKDSQ